jgi:hypothetical protein
MPSYIEGRRKKNTKNLQIGLKSGSKIIVSYL